MEGMVGVNWGIREGGIIKERYQSTRAAILKTVQWEYS